MNSRGKFSYAFKIATTVCCFIGLALNIFKAKSLSSLLSYFTIQSNILVFIFYLSIVVLLHFKVNIENSKIYHILKGVVLMGILLTFSVYAASLSPLNFHMDLTDTSDNIFRTSNLFVHLITPMMVLADYILFDKKGSWKKSYIPIWCIFPILYLFFVYTYVSKGNLFLKGGSTRFVYFFLDTSLVGLDGVIFYILLITVLYIAMCYLFIAFDKLLYKRKAKRQFEWTVFFYSSLLFM